MHRLLTLVVLLSLATPSASSVQAAGPDWQSRRADLTPLDHPRQWILQGTKLANGACEYHYPSVVTEIPSGGWTIRTIGIDVRTCRKLFEEGTPAAFGADPGAELVVATTSPSAGDASVASTRSAWQRVVWRDVVGVLVNAVMVEVTWKYNGSTVSAGSTRGGWQFNTATKWRLTAKTLTDSYGSGSSYYRGQSTATFTNDYFCDPLPVVHTYYYYVRVWGHPNGTSTRSQSSDSVDECLPLHVDIEAAYGTWPG